jgi:hypothetical protein
VVRLIQEILKPDALKESDMSRNFEIQLLLRLKDQASSGFKAAMQAVQSESKATENSILGVAAAAARIKSTPIERMTSALRTMRSAASAAHETLMKVAQAGAAVAAGGYVLKSAAERPMAYDRKLALAANTAYGDRRDVAGRIAGTAEIGAGIRDAVKRFGGTPEQVLDTFATLVGSGAMGKGQAGVKSSLDALPFLQQAATGTGASGNDLAQIYLAAKQNMGMSDAEAKVGISKAIKGGQEGGFELKDMSRWLPQQMAMAANIGMKGMGGFESLISANQATRMTAGTADEAGNDLVNLLAKVTSNDTANDFKKQHVDLYGSLTASMATGKNTLEAFVGILYKLGSKDAKYLELKAKADAAKTDPEKQKLYQSMADVMMSKGIGQSVQDRQALTGLFGMISPTGKYKEVLSAVKKENGAESDMSFKTVAATTDFKAEQVGNNKAFAAMDTLAAVKGPLDTLLDGVNKGADAFPGFTAGLYAATVAVGALAAASLGASLLGSKGGGVLNFLKSVLPGGLAAGAEAGGGGLVAQAGGALMVAARALTLPALALTGLIEGGGAAINAYRGEDANNTLSSMVKGTAFSDLIGETIARSLSIFGNATAKEAVQINVHLDGEQIASVVNGRNVRQANRY